MSINYFQESEKYRPERIGKKIKTLLIGEAPPPSEKYFYVPMKINSSSPIETARSLPATIFNHYFQKRPKDEMEYRNYLKELQNIGVFLIDITDEQLRVSDRSCPGWINQENLIKVVSEIPNLRAKIRARDIDIEETKIIFLLARNKYIKELKEQFPMSQLFRWKDFRLRTVDCVCCRGLSYLKLNKPLQRTE